jgi:hypothetical protein
VRRLLPFLVVAVFAVAATAVAQGGGSGVPVVRSAQVLHLDASRDCHGSPLVTLRVTPPSDVQIAWLAVRLNGRQVVRLTGVTGAASVTVRLPRSHSRVSGAGQTLDGQSLYQVRAYRSCLPHPSPPEPRRQPPVIIGGGEA